MRLFVTLKQNNRSLQTRRIQFQSKQQTTQYLITQLRRILKIDKNAEIIARLIPKTFNTTKKSSNNCLGLKLRIIQGWKLEDYKIESGMQIQIQILRDFCSTDHVNEGDNQKLSQTLQTNGIVFKKQIQQIKEQEEDDENISKIIQQKYEELLRHIQKGNFGRFMKQLKYPHPKLDSCENEYYHQQLLAILKQLGEKGWAAIHYAVYSGCIQALRFLFQNDVDVNLKTLDDWTPLQLAINQQNVQIVELLASQPLLDPNLLTSHGLPIIMALNINNLEIIKCLMRQDIDLSIRDYKGISVYDILKEEEANAQLMKIFRQVQQRSSITQNRSETFHTLISLFRGEVIQVRTPPRRDKQIYLVINPYDKTIEIFQSKQKYPSCPKELIPISQSIYFQILNKEERSWYMKEGNVVFLMMNGKKKLYQFGVHFEKTAKQWCKSLIQCQENIKGYKSKIDKFIRNEKIIFDRIQMNVNSPTKNCTKNIMEIFTSRIQSDPKSSIQKDQKQTSNGSTHTQKKSVQKQVNCPIKQNSTNNLALIQNNQEQQKQAKGIKFSDFSIIRSLGQGAFGAVFLARDQRNPEKQKLYALKCFKKKKLIINKQIKYTIAQLNILKQLSHPFIVNLHFTFQTPNYVYLGLDYCKGKDLAHHLIEEVTFNQNDARFYAAQILCALDYLHSKNIIYRDLKPDNIMLDEEGHIKLIDFGLSKQGNDTNFTAKSFCGSPAYISPEMLLKGGVTKQSDYYCLGAVLYQMIVGEPPYFSDDIQILYNNISHGKLSFPKNVSSDSKDILTKLLERNPSKRLGKSNISQIKKHNFFKKIDWEALQRKQLKPPKRQYDMNNQEDQLQQELVKIIHKDFDYMGDNYRINRFVNFSFEREK